MKEFEYYAFISYSHKDEKWAKWLQNKLENYKLPSVIRQENSRLPERIYPVFRDKTDLSAGPLFDSIKKELEASQYLIVISSPESAKSEWVGKEIKAFIEMGRTQKIIPFIVEGTPNSGDENECFHPILKNELPENLEPLGINKNEIGQDQAFAKIAAKLLDLRFDSLWNRYRRAQKRNRFLIAAASVILLIGLTFTVDYFRVKKTYYADYVDKWGTPVGVIELKRPQVKNRSAHYRFEERFGSSIFGIKRKVIRVVYANSAGRPIKHTHTEFNDRPSIQVFEYLRDNVKYTFIQNTNEQDQIVYDWRGNTIIDFKSDREGRYGASLGSSFTSISENMFSRNESRAIIRRYELERDDYGFITRIEFKRNDENVPASDNHGIWGFEYVLDNLGRRVTMRYLGKEGENKPDRTGVMGRKYEYDKTFGTIIKTIYFGEDEKPVFNEHLWAVYEAEIDEYGNVITESFFDPDGNPCYEIDGYAKIRRKYNRGNNTETGYYDTDDNPCFAVYGCAKWEAEYNKKGYITKRIFLDTYGNPCFVDDDSYAIIRYWYDKRGNITEEAYYDTDDDLCMKNGGYASKNNWYDKEGNLTEEAYYDTDNNVCMTDYGYASICYEYDDRGNLTKIIYFDTEDYYYMDDDYGYAALTANYDIYGNLKELAYFDEYDNPCVKNDGYAKLKIDYDDRGNSIKFATYDLDNNLCIDESDGTAIWRMEYDDSGNRTKESYFDINDEPCLNNENVAGWEAEYNDRGNIIKQIYFGTDGKPVMHIDDYAILRLEYDNRGNVIKKSYFDTEDKPCIINDSYSSLRYSYDLRDNCVEMATLDINGKLCIDEGDNTAMWRWKYDERRRKIEEAYFGIDGEPCIDENDGTAIWRWKYDERSNKAEEAYFGIDGNPCLKNGSYAKWTAKYDNRRNQIEIAYYGVDGNLILIDDGYAIFRTKYDEKGNVIEYATFDTEGNLCIDKDDGTAMWRMKYDDWGNLIERAYFDADGNPCLNNEGYARWAAIYDENGDFVEYLYYDTAGNIVEIESD